MRFPKLSELLGGGKLGALMQRLFQRPNMQLGAGVKRGEQEIGPGGLLRRAFGGSTVSPAKPRPNTATPHQATVFRTLTKQRQDLVESRSAQGRGHSAASDPIRSTNKPSILQQSATVFRTLREYLIPQLGAGQGGRSTVPSQTAPPKPFTPSRDWQEVPQGTSIPPGGQVRMDMGAGKSFARWPNAPVAANDTPTGATDRTLPSPKTTATPSTPASAPTTTPSTPVSAPPTTAAPAVKDWMPSPQPANPSNRPSMIGGAVSSAKSFVTNVVQAIGGHRQPTRSTSPTTSTPPAREAMRATAASATQRAKSEGAKQSASSARLDKLQRLGDVAGVVDPSGIVDGINAVVSLKRAHDEPERRGEHIRNAIVSGLSVVPLIGDLAKLTKVGKAEKGAAAAAKGRHATSAVPSASKPAGKSFVSQILRSVDKWGPIAMEGAQAVFSNADRSSAAAAAKPTTKAGSSVQQPSILGRLAKSATAGIGSIFGGRRESPQQSSATGAAQPPPTSPAGAPWWSKKDDQASAPIGTPAPGFYGQSQPVWKRAMYGWWQSKFGGGAKQETGRSRRRRSSDQPNVPESPSPIEAPSQPAPRTFGERVRSAVSGVGAAVSAGFGYRNEQPRSSASAANALNQESNFGDVMGGKKKLEDVEKEVEGNRQLSESKERFAEAVKNATGRLGALAVGAIVLTKGLERLNAASIARQASLIEVSPGHSFAAGRAEIARINRDILSGSGTSGSFARRVEAQSGLENAMRPGRDMMANIANNAMAKFTTWFTTLIEIGNYWAREAAHAAETGVKGFGFGTGGLIGGSLGATVGKALADATIKGAKNLADGKPTNQSESWQHLFDDLASGKLTGPKSPRKL